MKVTNMGFGASFGVSLRNILMVLFVTFVSISCQEQPAAAEQPNEVVSETATEVEAETEPEPEAAMGTDVDDKVNNMGESANMDLENSDNKMNNGSSDLTTIYFGFDKFDLNSKNVDISNNNANKLSNNTDINIKLEGNCDEWGSDEYNYALGLKRAKAVKNNLISNGINETRISIVSYGESNSVCSEKNKTCWGKNRRVDTKFLP